MSLMLFVFLFAVTGVIYAQVGWLYDYQRGLSTSQAQSKPLLIYFYTQEALNCQRFDRETFSDPRVGSLLGNFVCVRLDMKRNLQEAYKAGIYRVPVILILDTGGNEIMRLVTFYPADRFIEVLNKVVTYFASGRAAANSAAIKSRQEETTVSPMAGKALYYESFDRLYGWGSDFAKDCYAQISLVKGVRGNAFRIDYDLMKGAWSFVQFSRKLLKREKVKLPAQYTISFYLAGAGAKSNLDFKLVDGDGTNFGIILPFPTDNKWHIYEISSDKIGYLWGGNDKKFDIFSEVWFAAGTHSVVNGKEIKGEGGKGVLFIDELAILPAFSKAESANWSAAPTAHPAATGAADTAPRFFPPAKFIIAEHFDNLYGSNVSFDPESFAQSSIMESPTSGKCVRVNFQFAASQNQHYVQFGKAFSSALPPLTRSHIKMYLNYDGPPALLEISLVDKDKRRLVAQVPISPSATWQEIAIGSDKFKPGTRDIDSSKLWVSLIFNQSKGISGKCTLMVVEFFLF